MPRGQYERQPREGIPQEPQSAETVQPAALSPRAAETRRERRRRDDGDIDRMARLKLAIPRDVQDKAKQEGKVLRWVLDEGGRQSQMHEDDWDVVEGVKPVAAGQSDDQKLVLMSKYKDWHEKDLAADERDMTAMESALMSGDDPETRSKGLVVPQGQRNRISRERGL
jgi:hypothetical protein